MKQSTSRARRVSRLLATTSQHMKKYSFLAIAAGLLLSTDAPAAVILASDAGFVTEAGGSAKGDATVAPGAKYNYSVGRELHYSAGFLFSPLVAMDRRNYFVFDLTGVTDPIISATLTLWSGTLESVDATESYGLFETTDVPGALGIAAALAGATMTTAYDDAGDPLIADAASLYMKLAASPVFLGGIVISSAADDSFIDITFTPGGLGYLNSFLGSTVILGGKVPTAIPPPSPQQPFGFTGPDSFPGGKTPKLTVTTVPEPSAVVLVLGALVATAARRRRV